MAKTIRVKGAEGNGLFALALLMEKVSAAVVKDVNTLQGNIAAKVHYDVARATPVDVGTARSNWVVSVGAPFLQRIAAYAPRRSQWHPPYTGTPGIGERSNLNGARAQAASALDTSLGKDGVTIYINNNSPYIARLNDGHSGQAPAGFVQAGVATGTSEAVKAFKFPYIRALF